MHSAAPGVALSLPSHCFPREFDSRARALLQKAAGQFDRERLSLEADRAALVRSLTVADSRQRAEASTVMSRAASQSSDLARRLQRSEAACDRLRTLNASLAAEVARLRVGDTRRGSASAALTKASTSDGESWVRRRCCCVLLVSCLRYHCLCVVVAADAMW